MRSHKLTLRIACNTCVTEFYIFFHNEGKVPFLVKMQRVECYYGKFCYLKLHHQGKTTQVIYVF